MTFCTRFPKKLFLECDNVEQAFLLTTTTMLDGVIKGTRWLDPIWEDNKRKLEWPKTTSK